MKRDTYSELSLKHECVFYIGPPLKVSRRSHRNLMNYSLGGSAHSAVQLWQRVNSTERECHLFPQRSEARSFHLHCLPRDRSSHPHATAFKFTLISLSVVQIVCVVAAVNQNGSAPRPEHCPVRPVKNISPCWIRAPLFAGLSSRLPN